MTLEQAKWVRVLRVDLECTWSRVGELYRKVVCGGTDDSGGHLCYKAAAMLGEDGFEEPWN